jgi:hypothetical protein
MSKLRANACRAMTVFAVPVVHTRMPRGLLFYRPLFTYPSMAMSGGDPKNLECPLIKLALARPRIVDLHYFSH